MKKILLLAAILGGGYLLLNRKDNSAPNSPADTAGGNGVSTDPVKNLSNSVPNRDNLTQATGTVQNQNPGIVEGEPNPMDLFSTGRTADGQDYGMRTYSTQPTMEMGQDTVSYCLTSDCIG